MGTWIEFEREAPEVAQRAQAILTSTTNCVLATLRADGSPRVSGIDPFFVHGELHIGSMPAARKADDLRRDPRMALHGVPFESRRLKEGADDPGQVDAKLTGRAVEIEVEEAKRIMAWYWEQLGRDAPEHETSDGDGNDEGYLFRIDVESVTLVSVEDDEVLVIDTWRAGAGRTTVRRA